MGYWSQVRAALAGSRQTALSAMRTAGDSQRRTLAEILHANCGSAFGRTHRFSEIRNEPEFRQAVPVRASRRFVSVTLHLTICGKQPFKVAFDRLRLSANLF